MFNAIAKKTREAAGIDAAERDEEAKAEEKEEKDKSPMKPEEVNPYEEIMKEEEEERKNNPYGQELEAQEK